MGKFMRLFNRQGSKIKAISGQQYQVNRAGYDIKPSSIPVSWGAETPMYWFADNPFLSHFMNAFSGILPQGEHFMISSVRAVRERVSGHDKNLMRDISGFIGQEAHHAKMHQSFNNLLAERGLPIRRLEQMMDGCIHFLNRLSEKDRMAVTGATEHFTALFGKIVLNSPEIIQQTHPSMREVLVWHAIEELEHKAVAYDVYQALDGSYWRRIYGVLLATTLISSTVVYGQVSFLLADKSITNVSSSMKGLWWMFGVGSSAGYFRKALPDYFAFFRPGFHPLQDDDMALIQQWKSQFMPQTA